MSITDPRPAPRADATRRALLDAGLRVFGRDGYAAASNRGLADEAGVNQALIGYHFGGKEGLYLAVFERIADDIGGRVAGLAAEVESRLDALAGTGVAPAERHARCVETATLLVGGHLRLLMEPRMADYAKLIIREQLEPTRAFDILWEGMLGRLLGLLSRLVALAEGEREAAERHRLFALTLIGQALVFRVARATVVAHMGWPAEPGAAEIDAVDARVRANVEALLGVPRPGDSR